MRWGMDDAIPHWFSFTRDRQRLSAFFIESVFQPLTGPGHGRLYGAFCLLMLVAPVYAFLLFAPDSPAKRGAFGCRRTPAPRQRRCPMPLWCR